MVHAVSDDEKPGFAGQKYQQKSVDNIVVQESINLRTGTGGVMRITGGIFRGRQIKVPSGNCRPTQDMVRQAMFSMIGPRVEGARFLDMFAGSGVVGLEALSRGARSACWIESDRRALSVLKENVERIYPDAKSSAGRSSLRFIGGNVLTFLQKGLENQKFDLIFADPPYDRNEEKGWVGRILDILASVDVLAPGGLFIMEQSSKEGFGGESGSWALVRDKVYGSTRLRFFAMKETGGSSNDKKGDIRGHI